MTLSVKVGAAAAGSNATTAAAPAAVTVPADNTVDEADVVRLVATVDTGTVVTFTATGAVKLVAALDNPAGARVRAADGVQALAVATGTGTTATVYAFTTTTAAGTVTVSNLGVTNTIYLKGTAGAANAISLVSPSAAAVGTIAKYVVSAVDVFGNKVSGLTVNATVAGATVAATGVNTATLTTAVETATVGLGNAELAVLAPAAGSSITVVMTATVANAVSGLAAPVSTVAAVTPLNDLTAQLAIANAALAAEKAAHDATKKAMADADAKAKADALAAKASADADKAKAVADAIAAESVKAVAAADVAAKAMADAKASFDKAIADMTAAKTAADKALAKLKARYNVKAAKHKFKPVK